MRFVPNVKKVLCRAWSVRLMLAAFVFTVAEVALPYLGGFIEPGYMAVLTGLATAGAFVARILAQKDMQDEE